MKKITFILFYLLVCQFAHSQEFNPLTKMVQNARINQIYTRISSPFKATKTNALANNLVSNALSGGGTTLELDKTILNSLLKNATSYITMSLPTYDGKNDVVLELVKVDIFSSDFKITTSSGDTIVPTEAMKGLHYQGIIKGNDKSFAAISMCGSEISGIFDDGSGNQVIGKIKNNDSYIVYKDSYLKQQNTFGCGTADLPDPTNNLKKGLRLNSPQSVNCGFLNIRFETDYAIYASLLNDENEVNYYVIRLFNQVSSLFRNESIAVRLNEIKINKTVDPFVGYGHNDEEFLAAWENSFGSNYNGNIAFFLTHRNIGGGVARLDKLCDKAQAKGLGYIYLNFNGLPTYTWDVEVVTHELGHIMGSQHTHWCGWANGAIDDCGPRAGYPTEGGCPNGQTPPLNSGTIMSYCHLTSTGISFNTGFGLLPGTKIRTQFNSACNLNYDTNPPYGLLTDDYVDNYSKKLVWTTRPSATNHIIQYKKSSSNTWIQVNEAIRDNSFVLIGLERNTSYDWKVKTDCSVFAPDSHFQTGPIIGLSILSQKLCQGQRITVSVPVTLGFFDNNNKFTVELSDSYGNFGNAVEIGANYGNVGGDIYCTIPSSLPISSNYFLRAYTSSPSVGRVLEQYISIGVQSPQITTCVAPATFVSDKNYGGANNDYAFASVPTPDGGYLFGGGSTTASEDFWVVKTDANRVKQWDKRFGGSGSDVILSMMATTDGNYLLGGRSNSSDGDKVQYPTQGGNDFWVIKMSPNGTLLNQRDFGGAGDDILTTLVNTPDGGYLLGGRTAQRGGTDFWVIKLNANLVVQWDKVFFGDTESRLNKMIKTLDNNFLLIGTTKSNVYGDVSDSPRGQEDYWILKIDAIDGHKIWDRRFGGSLADDAIDGFTLPDGGFIIAGHSYSGVSGEKTQASHGSTDWWIIKLNSSGFKIWDKSFGGNGVEDGPYIIQALDGGFLLGGATTTDKDGDISENTKGGYDYWLVKIDIQGNKIWDKRFGGNGDDYISQILQNADGTYLLTGGSNSNKSFDYTQNPFGLFDFWVVKAQPCPIKTTVCTGQNLNLYATGCSGTVIWSNGLTGSAITFPAPTTPTTYTASCTENGCTSLIASLLISIVTSSLSLSGTSTTGTQQANQIITSIQTINNGINTLYRAGNMVNLNTGFNSQNGAIFKAEIGGCSN